MSGDLWLPVLWIAIGVGGIVWLLAEDVRRYRRDLAATGARTR